MKAFMDENFLLSTETAKTLYHTYAKEMPIYDYHCHLNPKEILDNIQYRNISHLMLGGDHYKWRAMLSNGADESLMYGDKGTASDWEKFYAYASMLKYAIGNPLYHWTHLELQRVFGIYDILNEKTAKSIYDRANAMLATDEFRCRRLIEKFNVKVLCTTDDPADSLEYHKALAEDKSFKVRVLPTYRPDKALAITKPDYAEYIAKLGAVAGVEIKTVADLEKALEIRLDYFHSVGARISDHGMDYVPQGDWTEEQLNALLSRVLSGGAAATQEEESALKAYMQVKLGRMYAKRGWAMQLHMNALRNNNTRMYNRLGADVGFDSIDDTLIARNLSTLMNKIEQAGGLPKTILYSLNPCANYVIGTMLGNFQGGVPGKIQMGSGWWFCDQRDGMVDQMKTLANLGLLGRFVGMLTDSRSFVSYPRHEYFRRIMCDVIGAWVENGEYPADMEVLGELVQGICYNNAKEYFGIALED